METPGDPKGDPKMEKETLETKTPVTTEMGWSVEVLTREEYLKWLYSQEARVAPKLTHSKHVSFF